MSLTRLVSSSALALISALALSACRTNYLDLNGSITAVSGQVQLNQGDGTALVLTSQQSGQSVSVQFYDNSGKGAVDLTVNNGNTISFQLDETSDQLKSGVDAVKAHGNSANQKSTVDLTAAPTETVDQTWTAPGTCVLYQDYETVCDGAFVANAILPLDHAHGPGDGDHGHGGGGDHDGDHGHGGGGDHDGDHGHGGGGDHDGDHGPHCYQRLHTVYGSAEFQFHRSGVIFHDNLHISQASGQLTLDLRNDNTSTSNSQVSPCN